MSQSPSSAQQLSARDDFQNALDSLDSMIFQGMSFSGREPNCAFLNTGEIRFATVSGVTGLDFDDDGRAVAVTDWDQDGDLDLWFQNRTAPQLRFMENQVGAKNRFLALKLQGTRSNRDAIGSRVTLTLADGRRLIRTVHAGDGFLAQSSKWVHFGLGPDSLPESLQIRWSSGRRDRFQQLKAGRRYLAVEGRPELGAWERPARKLPDSRREPELPTPTQTARIVMTTPVPLPPLQYRDFRDRPQTMTGQGQPILVNLWASWCGPCVKELRELAAQKETLAEAGIDILALSVDGLGDDGSSKEAAVAFLKRIDFPFAAGMANQGLLDRLQLIHNQLLDWHRPLPLPTSFLLDGDARLQVIYKGPVEIERLRADFRLPEEEDRRRDLALGFPGRWATPAGVLSFSHVALGFLEHGLVEEGAFYLKEAGTSMKKRGLTDANYAAAANRLGMLRMRQGQIAEAVTAFREALRFEPESASTLSNLGAALTVGGKGDEAIQAFEQALRADSQNPEVLSNLGAAFLNRGEHARAVEYFRQALEIDPNLARTHYFLGTALELAGAVTEAIGHYQKASELNPELDGPRARLAWVLATSPDRSARDGKRSVELATKLNEASGYRDPIHLDILAAAEAEVGHFSRAVQLVETALEIAGADQVRQLVSDLERRLSLYKQGLPYRAKR